METFIRLTAELHLGPDDNLNAAALQELLSGGYKVTIFGVERMVLERILSGQETVGASPAASAESATVTARSTSKKRTPYTRPRCPKCRRNGRLKCPVHGTAAVKKTPKASEAVPSKPNLTTDVKSASPAPPKPKYHDSSNNNVLRSSGRAALAERAAHTSEHQNVSKLVDGAPEKLICALCPKHLHKDGAPCPDCKRRVCGTCKVSYKGGICKECAAKIPRKTVAEKPFEIKTCENCKHRIADAKKCPGCSKLMCVPCARLHGNLCDECHDVPE